MIPKFRAYDIEICEMFYDVSVVTTYDDNKQHVIADFGMYNETEYSGTEIINYKLMQSIGLFDTNGVEIFEGDVVNAYDYDYDEGKIYKTTDSTGVIIYKENSFYLKDEEGIFNNMWVNAEEIEIIGNIYQNKELVEGEND